MDILRTGSVLSLIMNTDLKQTWTATKRTAYQAQETWNQNGVFLARKYKLTQAEVATVRLTLPKKKNR